MIKNFNSDHIQHHPGSDQYYHISDDDHYPHIVSDHHSHIDDDDHHHPHFGDDQGDQSTLLRWAIVCFKPRSPACGLFNIGVHSML